MKNKLFTAIQNSDNILLAGHISPDGDCIGSTLALGQYIQSTYQKKVTIYLEDLPKIYDYLEGMDLITHTLKTETDYDLCIALDCGDLKRLGEAAPFFEKATATFNIDHHISNTQFAQENHVEAESSSTCEVLFELLEENQLTKAIAEALYTGIVFDTGVFRHNSTSRRTLEIAGRLITYGFNFSSIIDRVFFEKSFSQSKLLGKALTKSQLILDGFAVYSVVDLDDFKACSASKEDTDGIIEQLRVIKDVQVAFFLYESEKGRYKTSFRSNETIDVSQVAKAFGGGGHKKASGCLAEGDLDTIVTKIIHQIREQMN